ncbi:glycosyltransferase [Rhodococcus sp. 5G237]
MGRDEKRAGAEGRKTETMERMNDSVSVRHPNSVQAQNNSYGAVVLYYRLGPSIAKTIHALEGQTSAPSRIVVVDNASGDGVIEELFSGSSNVLTVTLSENKGYAGGMNAGFQALGQEYPLVLFMTHEVILERDCVERLVEGLRSGSHALAGPILRRGETQTIWSAGGGIGVKGNVYHRLTPPEPTSTDWLDGACLLVESTAYREVKGFDEDYFLYWEDVDLGSRIRAIGTVACIRNAYASQDTNTTPIYFGTRNQIMYWRKRKGMKNVLLSCLSSAAKMVLRDLPSMSTERLRARAWGIFDGLTGRLRLQHGSIREG